MTTEHEFLKQITRNGTFKALTGAVMVRDVKTLLSSGKEGTTLYVRVWTTGEMSSMFTPSLWDAFDMILLDLKESMEQNADSSHWEMEGTDYGFIIRIYFERDQRW